MHCVCTPADLSDWFLSADVYSCWHELANMFQECFQSVFVAVRRTVMGGLSLAPDNFCVYNFCLKLLNA